VITKINLYNFFITYLFFVKIQGGASVLKNVKQ
jgi:hypothetical protein